MSEQQKEFLAKMTAALGGGQPSAFAEDLRSQGIAVVQRPAPASVAPVPPPVPPGPFGPQPTPSPQPLAAPAPLQAISTEDLTELVEARAAAPAVDPRLAWREAQVAAIVARGLMPEALARATVNSGKKAEIEAWLGAVPAVGSSLPPQGQAPQAPLQAPAQAAPQGAPSAAQVASQPASADPRLDQLVARVEALDRGLFAKQHETHLAEFTAAGAELREIFPRMVTPDGKLEPRVARAAKLLLQDPDFKSASARQVLQAASAAVFSIEPQANAAPVTPSPRTPVPGGDLGGERRPLTNPEIAVLVMELRSHHGNGNPHSLSKTQQAAVDADLARIVAARR